LRLFSYKLPDSARNLWDAPNVLLQKFPADEFMVTTKINFVPNPKLENEKAGLAVMGLSYANLALKSKKVGTYLVFSTCKGADKGNAEIETEIAKLNDGELYLRVEVTAGGKCNFYYSKEGISFTKAGEEFTAEVGRWIGAKVGLFCTRETQINDSGWADFDWFRVEKPDTKR
ncbi:MAG: beta-xylosidase family glycoside hydrolase, partial [Flavisolibacter sp.]